MGRALTLPGLRLIARPDFLRLVGPEARNNACDFTRANSTAATPSGTEHQGFVQTARREASLAVLGSRGGEESARSCVRSPKAKHGAVSGISRSSRSNERMSSMFRLIGRRSSGLGARIGISVSAAPIANAGEIAHRRRDRSPIRGWRSNVRPCGGWRVHEHVP
jgi:hypothetical protein